MTDEQIICTFMDPDPQRGFANDWWWLAEELGPGWDTWQTRENWPPEILQRVIDKLDPQQREQYDRKYFSNITQQIEALARSIILQPILTWTGSEWLVDENPPKSCFCCAVIPGACRGFGPHHDINLLDFTCR